MNKLLLVRKICSALFLILATNIAFGETSQMTPFEPSESLHIFYEGYSRLNNGFLFVPNVKGYDSRTAFFYDENLNLAKTIESPEYITESMTDLAGKTVLLTMVNSRGRFYKLPDFRPLPFRMEELINRYRINGEELSSVLSMELNGSNRVYTLCNHLVVELKELDTPSTVKCRSLGFPSAFHTNADGSTDLYFETGTPSISILSVDADYKQLTLKKEIYLPFSPGKILAADESKNLLYGRTYADPDNTKRIIYAVDTKTGEIRKSKEYSNPAYVSNNIVDYEINFTKPGVNILSYDGGTGKTGLEFFDALDGSMTSRGSINIVNKGETDHTSVRYRPLISDYSSGRFTISITGGGLNPAIVKVDFSTGRHETVWNYGRYDYKGDHTPNSLVPLGKDGLFVGMISTGGQIIDLNTKSYLQSFVSYSTSPTPWDTHVISAKNGKAFAVLSTRAPVAGYFVDIFKIE